VPSFLFYRDILGLAFGISGDEFQLFLEVLCHSRHQDMFVDLLDTLVLTRFILVKFISVFYYVLSVIWLVCLKEKHIKVAVHYHCPVMFSIRKNAFFLFVLKNKYKIINSYIWTHYHNETPLTRCFESLNFILLELFYGFTENRNLLWCGLVRFGE